MVGLISGCCELPVGVAVYSLIVGFLDFGFAVFVISLRVCLAWSWLLVVGEGLCV